MQTATDRNNTEIIKKVIFLFMASRELKDSELAKGIAGTKIAIDGIAVVVNNGNPLEEMSSLSVKNIYTGTFTKWSDVK